MILAYQDAFSEVVDGVTDADFVIDVEVDVKGSSRESWFTQQLAIVVPPLGISFSEACCNCLALILAL